MAASDTFDAMASVKEYRKGKVYRHPEIFRAVSEFAQGAVVDTLTKSSVSMVNICY